MEDKVLIKKKYQNYIKKLIKHNELYYSKDKPIISDKEYEDGIKEYLNKRGINDYRVLEKEKGNIPMTCFPFEKSNTDKLIYIGTAGGWTKPSTGYTIKNTIEKTEELVSFIKSIIIRITIF